MYNLPEDNLFRLEEGPDIPPKPADKLVTHLAAMHSPVFEDYLTMTRHQHAQSIKVTFKEIAKDVVEVGISYGIGAVATLGYITAAQKAAKGNIFNYYMNPIGAVLLNFLVNGFFFEKWASQFIDFLIMQLPAPVQAAYMRLKNLDTSCSSTLLRSAKGLILFLIILAPSLLSGFPFYALDRTQSNHSEIISEIVWLSATALQYNGVEAFLYEFIPLVLSPFKAIYRRFNDEAMRNYKIQTSISLLKNAHKEAWGSIHQEVLKLIQIKQEDKLQDILALDKISNPTREEAILLLKKLWELAKKEEYQPSVIGRLIVQIIIQGLNFASLPGYLLTTIEGVAAYAQLHNKALEWTLGGLIFFVYSLLNVKVTWSCTGSLYNMVSYGVNGIKKAWNSSESYTDFFKKALDPASLHDIFKAPLALQHNRFLIILILIICILGYWSASTSLYLNEVTLGPDIAQYLVLATISSSVLFNDFPVPEIGCSGGHFLSRLFGSEKTKAEIKLEKYILNQEKLSTEMDDFKFLELANEIVENVNLSPTKKESALTLFFGNKTPAEIFGEDHKYGKRKFIEIIPRLKNKQIHELSLVGFFSRRKAEEDPLLSNIQGYGATKLSTLVS